MLLLESSGIEVEIEPELHRAVKALVADPAHKVAVQFIVDRVCGRHRISFVAGGPAETMAFFEGRRYCGELIMRMSERPVVEPEKKEPYARSITEQVARRARNPKP